MVTRYLDPQAADGGDGSENHPLNKIPANLADASWADGDVLLLKRGSRYLAEWSGLDAAAVSVNRASIRIGAYWVGPRPIIEADYTGTGTGKLFSIFSSDFVLEDVCVQNMFQVSGVYAGGGAGINNVTVRRCEFRDLRGNSTGPNAIVLGTENPCTGRIVIADNFFQRICNDGIQVNCSNFIEIARNKIIDVSWDADKGDCIGVSGNCQFLWIHDNYLDHRSRGFKQLIIQDGGDVGFALVENNECLGYNLGEAVEGHTGVVIFLPALVRYNRINSWRNGVYCDAVNAVVRDNFIVQTGGNATGAGIQMRKGRVIGNTLIHFGNIDQHGAAIHMRNDDASNQVRNNLIVGFARGIRKGPAAVESNNAFADVGQCVLDEAGNPQAMAASDISSTVAALKLSSEFQLEVGSPLIGIGNPVGAYSRDVDGHQRRRYPSIGARDPVTLRIPPAS